MAKSESAAALTWASGSATASGTTNAVSISTYYGSTLYVKIVVVGTATTAASYKVQVTPDASTYYDYPSNSSYTAGTAAATYEWAILLPTDGQSVQVVYTAQQGGTSSTLTGHVGRVAIS